MLNVSRARLVQAMAVAQGVGVAQSSEPLDHRFYEAWVDDESQAERLANRENLERLARKVKARYGM